MHAHGLASKLYVNVIQILMKSFILTMQYKRYGLGLVKHCFGGAKGFIFSWESTKIS